MGKNLKLKVQNSPASPSSKNLCLSVERLAEVEHVEDEQGIEVVSELLPDGAAVIDISFMRPLLPPQHRSSFPERRSRIDRPQESPEKQ